MIAVLSGSVPVDDEVVEIGREALKHGLFVWAASETRIAVGRAQTTLYDDLFRAHEAVRFLEVYRAAYRGDLPVTMAKLARQL